jgi:DNA primase
MPRYTVESIARLKLNLRVVEIIGSYIELKPAGRLYKGCCPFHDEKSPSFVVDPSDQHYHCYGCGAHGDALGFLMNYLQLPFHAALELCSEKSGVTLEATNERSEESSKEGEKKRLRALLSKANDFFHGILLHTKEGHYALSYLDGRGIDLEMVIHFRLGWIPDGTWMIDYLIAEGFSPNEIQAAGLIAQVAHRRTPFAQRVSFPLYESGGHIVGFSARKIDETVFGGKYINSPETILFKKSKFLFGMSQSRRRIAKDKMVILVEGQIDALRLIHIGLDCCAAALGTAFGEQHAQMLMQIGVKEVVLAFDRDRAGTQAALKVGNLFQSRGISVSVVLFPLGDDPDSYIRQKGEEALIALLDARVDYLSFLVEVYSETEDVQTPQGRNSVIKMLAQQIRQWSDPTLVYQSLLWVANRFDIPPNLLGVQAAPSTAHRSPSVLTAKVQKGPLAPSLKVLKPETTVLEDELLRWLLLERENPLAWIEMAEKTIAPTDLINPVARYFYLRILEAFRQGSPSSYQTLTSQLVATGEEVQSVEVEIDMALEYLDHLSQRKISSEKSFERFLETLQKLSERNWFQKREQIHQLIASKSLSPEEERIWIERFSALLKEKPNINSLLGL